MIVIVARERGGVHVLNVCAWGWIQELRKGGAQR